MSVLVAPDCTRLRASAHPRLSAPERARLVAPERTPPGRVTRRQELSAMLHSHTRLLLLMAANLRLRHDKRADELGRGRSLHTAIVAASSSAQFACARHACYALRDITAVLLGEPLPEAQELKARRAEFEATHRSVQAAWAAALLSFSGTDAAIMASLGSRQGAALYTALWGVHEFHELVLAQPTPTEAPHRHSWLHTWTGYGPPHVALPTGGGGGTVGGAGAAAGPAAGKAAGNAGGTRYGTFTTGTGTGPGNISLESLDQAIPPSALRSARLLLPGLFLGANEETTSRIAADLGPTHDAARGGAAGGASSDAAGGAAGDGAHGAASDAASSAASRVAGGAAGGATTPPAKAPGCRRLRLALRTRSRLILTARTSLM